MQCNMMQVLPTMFSQDHCLGKGLQEAVRKMASFSLMEGTLKTCGPKSSFSVRIPIKVPTKIHVRKTIPLFQVHFRIQPLFTLRKFQRKTISMLHQKFIQIKALHQMQNIINIFSKIKDIQLSAQNDMHVASDFRNGCSHTSQLMPRGHP